MVACMQKRPPLAARQRTSPFSHGIALISRRRPGRERRSGWSERRAARSTYELERHGGARSGARHSFGARQQLAGADSRTLTDWTLGRCRHDDARGRLRSQVGQTRKQIIVANLRACVCACRSGWSCSRSSCYSSRSPASCYAVRCGAGSMDRWSKAMGVLADCC